MVDIISKKEGPRREDVAARRLIENSQDVITRLADQLSGGTYSASRNRKPEPPKPTGLVIHDCGRGRGTRSAPEPYIRVSPNNRVVMVDYETNRQMQMLGEIRSAGGVRRFVLATAANGFFSPLDPMMEGALTDLDGAPICSERTAEALATEIGARLGIAWRA